MWLLPEFFRYLFCLFQIAHFTSPATDTTIASLANLIISQMLG